MAKKKSKKNLVALSASSGTARLVSKKEMRRATHELHYYAIETVAKEFRSKRERAAIAALWKWLSLNGFCAWNRGRDKSIYDTTAIGPGRPKGRIWKQPDAVVISQDTWDRARVLLGAED